MTETNYKELPALARYIDRIGAIQLNFKRFMVQEEKGKYYIERSLITLLSDGSIECSNPEHEPTDMEREAIRQALMDYDFPKCIHATQAQFKALHEKIGLSSVVYPFLSRKTGLILMAQERREDPEKGKRYIPWTMFSDGKWRAMEPDGKLPFYKPKERTSTRIMIHEGAKAAEAASKVKKSHPWYGELKEYEHWGIIGGALAPHRADYAELGEEKPIEVVYVCDNDLPGVAAIHKVSEHWGRSLKKIVFGSDFPLSWDIADEIPKNFFNSNGVYNGPSLKSFMNPATRATMMIPNPTGKGKEIAVLTKEFREEWRHTVSPEWFINVNWPHRMYTEKEFNSVVRPYSNVNDTAAMLRACDESKASAMRYMPDLLPGVYSTEQGIIINNFLPSQIKPEEGSVKIWMEYLEHLIPIPSDRHEVMRWLATLIARPGIRMRYSLLLVSELHGLGKTTLGESILRHLVGDWNVSFPSGKDISGSAFNGWVARKRLVVINEIYAGHDSRVYDQLKTIISDAKVQINEKFVKEYTEDNWAHILASSNSMRALKIDDSDRRWLVPKLGEALKPEKFWKEFHTWLKHDRGLNKIAFWAEDFLKQNDPVGEGEHSPTTTTKRDMVIAGYSPGQTMVQELLERIRLKLGEEPWIILDTDLVNYIKNHLYDGRHSDRLERPLTVRKVAERLGLYIGKKNNGCIEWGIVKDQSRVISNQNELANLTPGQLNERNVRPLRLLDFTSI